jgi:hypothetical protein
MTLPKQGTAGPAQQAICCKIGTHNDLQVDKQLQTICSTVGITTLSCSRQMAEKHSATSCFQVLSARLHKARRQDRLQPSREQFIVPPCLSRLLTRQLQAAAESPNVSPFGSPVQHPKAVMCHWHVECRSWG